MSSGEPAKRLTRAERRTYSEMLTPPPDVDEQRWWAGISSAATAMRGDRGRFAKRSAKDAELVTNSQ
jgi:hypothetical protein